MINPTAMIEEIKMLENRLAESYKKSDTLQSELAQEREKNMWIPYVLHVQPVDKMPSHGRGFYPIMSYGKPSFQYWDEEGKRFDGDIRVDSFMDIILPYIPQPPEVEE
jgi:hypothetical protein